MHVKFETKIQKYVICAHKKVSKICTMNRICPRQSTLCKICTFPSKFNTIFVFVIVKIIWIFTTLIFISSEFRYLSLLFLISQMQMSDNSNYPLPFSTATWSSCYSRAMAVEVVSKHGRGSSFELFSSFHLLVVSDLGVVKTSFRVKSSTASSCAHSF